MILFSGKKERNKSRWEKAKNAERRHYTQTADLQIVSESRGTEILNRWDLGFGFFTDKQVLAVGGGTGIIHHLSNAQRVISLDPLNNLIFPNIDEDSNAEGITGAGEYLPFPDDSFDIIISANVIDHTNDPQKNLEEIARVMHPDGTFLFDVNVFRARWWSRKVTDYLDRPHPHHFDPVDVQEMLLDNFDVVELTSLIEIPTNASPSIFGRTKIFVANAVFGIRKACYICQMT